MRKIFFFIIFLLLLIISVVNLPVYAGTFPNISYIKEPNRQLSVMVQGWEYPSEVSPIVLTNPDGKRLYILSGGNSHICQSDGNMLNQDVVIPVSNCRVNASKNVIVPGDQNDAQRWLNPADIADEMVRDPWRFSYDGIFTVTVNPVTNKIFFGRYFEHQNYVYRWRSGFRECGNNPANYYLYRGNIHTNVSSDYCTCEQQSYVCQGWGDTNPLCIDGNNICPADLSGVEHDHSYPSMAVGATMGWADFSPTAGYQLSEVHDEGPIIWSQQAYRVNGKNAYKDVAPGESIIRNGYIYFFYTMKPRGNQNNNASCFGLARSRLEDNGLPGTWKNYYQGSFGPNALPSGFDKSRISEFYEAKGGAADCVLPLAEEYQDQGVATWINVAKFKDLPYYISVEETSPHWQTYQMGVRFSADLINWTPLQIIETKDTTWGDSNYTYPRFLNKEGTTNKEIDPEEFYLYGKRVGASRAFTIQSLKMSLILRSPEDKIEPVIKHYFNQLLNRNSSNLTYHKSVMDDSGCKGVIKDITSGVEFDSGYKSTTTDEEYIHILFRAILAREVSSSDGGYQWWLANLKNGNYNRDTIVDALVKISEAQNACITGKELTANDLIGDINQDGVVDIQDYILLSNAFGTNDQSTDLNNDGVVDIQDYIILSNNFGKTS